MSVDLSDSAYDGYEGRAYLRFDVDAQLGCKAAGGLSLRLRTATNSSANSDHSGAVWQVVCLQRPHLFGTTPAPIGNAPVAGDLGAVAEDSTVIWSLPSGLGAASTPLCLRVRARITTVLASRTHAIFGRSSVAQSSKYLEYSCGCARSSRPKLTHVRARSSAVILARTLSIVPTSTNGVDYLNQDAPDPAQAPALLIDVQ